MYDYFGNIIEYNYIGFWTNVLEYNYDYSESMSTFVKMFIKLEVYYSNKFLNFTTRNVLLTSSFQQTLAAFFWN